MLIAAHPDDESLACSIVLQRVFPCELSSRHHSKKGNEIGVIQHLQSHCQYWDAILR